MFRRIEDAHKRSCFQSITGVSVWGIALGVLLASANVSNGQSPLTYDRVIELLKLEVKEEKLLQLLKAQPTVFTLSEANLSELSAAGASRELIAAMQVNSTTVIESDTSAYVMILDASGSMLEKASDGATKWDVAKKSASELIAAVPEGLAFSVIVYGHDRQDPCGVGLLRELSPLSENDKVVLTQQIEQIEPVGKTPITDSLVIAAEMLEPVRGLAKILLITDGIETCQGDAAEVARRFTESEDSKRSVDVIGFALAGDEDAAVRKIATAGKGQYVEAKSGKELAIAFDRATQELRKLTKTDGAVTLSASKDLADPTVISIGTYTKARLAIKNSHYWQVDFPAGRYFVVFDAESADRREIVVAKAFLGIMQDGKLMSEADASVSNEVRGRNVIRVDLSAPATKLIEIDNIYTNLMDYNLGVFRADETFGVPFLVNCPEITATEFGRAATSPAIGTAADFTIDRDAFFDMTIPAGDSHLEVTWNGTANDEFGMNRSVTIHDLLGVHVKSLLSLRDKSAQIKIQTADPEHVILRVRGAAKGERITVKLSN